MGEAVTAVRACSLDRRQGDGLLYLEVADAETDYCHDLVIPDEMATQAAQLIVSGELFYVRGRLPERLA